MIRFRRSFLIVLTLLAGPASALATTTFSDSTFNLSNYTTAYTYKSDTNDTDAISQTQTAGNPSPGLDINITEPDGGTPSNANGASIAIGLINNTFSYNPQTQGAIANISASIDKDITDNAVGTLGNYFRPLIEQDGNYFAYEAGIAGPTLASPGTTGYNTLAASGLTASDFVQFNPTTGLYGTANPNFDGDTMLLGLHQNLGATTVNGTVIDFNYDNLNLTLTTVPEPASLSAVVLLCAIFLARRGRPSGKFAKLR